MTRENTFHILSELRSFFRYFIVGTVSFAIDFLILLFMRECVFSSEATAFQASASVLVAFIVAYAFNYSASLFFVFKTASGSAKMHGFSLFGVLIVAVIGLLLTERLMHLGEFSLGKSYVAVKIAVSGIVMVWNYLGRKIIFSLQKKLL